MNRCWDKDPVVRPSFSDLVTDINKELESMTEYLNVGTFELQ